jgi:uncharacterized metal-binding protein YceD (DUF177 family)
MVYDSRPWSVLLRLDEVPEAGRHVVLEADEATRKAIAEAAGVVAVPQLTARFDVTQHGAEGLHVAGQVTANVIQTCVVTLEPVENVVEETVDLAFLPGAEIPEAREATGEEGLDLGADDPPEVLEDGTVDLGAIATEFLLLGIDPYPRKPGAVFVSPVEEDPDEHPFAALARLKKNQE